MGRQGRIVVPAELRSQLGFGEGDRLIARIEDGELRISTIRANLERARAMLRERAPRDRDLLAEFFAQRRRDAAQEQ